MSRDYSELMNAATELGEYSGFLNTEDEKAQAKVQNRFNSARNKFVYDELKEGADPETVKRSIIEELDEKEALQPEWSAVYAYVKEELIQRIDRESSKSPLVRKIVRWTPTALGVIAVIAYFSVRFFGGLEVSKPIETKLGIQQRAAALERVITYEEMAPAGYGFRSAVKALLRWPIEPSEEVVQGAQDFVTLTLSGHQQLSQENAICGGLIDATDDSVSEQEIELVQNVAEYVQQEDIEWEDPPVMTILTPIREAFPCSG